MLYWLILKAISINGKIQQGLRGGHLEQRSIIDALKEAGYRVTQPREAVLQVLQAHEEGLSPEEIHKLGKAIYPPLGLVTVYRTLEILNELELVRRLHGEEHCHRYASAIPEQHYLVCKVCHRILEFPCNGLDVLIQTVQAQTGYHVTQHLLELRGFCPDCWNNQSVPVSTSSCT
jgi:Fur family transcriptional regulator, ferric uptake regulator